MFKPTTFLLKFSCESSSLNTGNKRHMFILFAEADDIFYYNGFEEKLYKVKNNIPYYVKSLSLDTEEYLDWFANIKCLFDVDWDELKVSKPFDTIPVPLLDKYLPIYYEMLRENNFKTILDS